MKITKDLLYPFLLYSKPIQYNQQITLYPVTMEHILEFNAYSQSITVRKESRFPNKKIIKMNYLEFLIYAMVNPEFGEQYEMPDLKIYYVYLLKLLQLVCREHEITFNQQNGMIYINECEVTPEILDDLRRIIIIQNDIDFDMDEFLNYDTEKALKRAQEKSVKTDDKSGIEDYIDSLSVALNCSEEEIMNMPIRKFWRFIKRFNLHENYTIMKTGECSGMVSYKEPIRHWMCSIDDEDIYKNVKTSAKGLKDKIAGANS